MTRTCTFVALVSAGAGQGAAELVLMEGTARIDVVIGNGENGGRKVIYANVLRAERKLADVCGGTGSVAIGASQAACWLS